jgi:hypothetical protein
MSRKKHPYARPVSAFTGVVARMHPKSGVESPMAEFQRKKAAIQEVLPNLLKQFAPKPRVKKRKPGERPGQFWKCKCGREHKLKKERYTGAPLVSLCPLCGDYYRG